MSIEIKDDTPFDPSVSPRGEELTDTFRGKLNVDVVTTGDTTAANSETVPCTGGLSTTSGVENPTFPGNNDLEDDPEILEDGEIEEVHFIFRVDKDTRKRCLERWRLRAAELPTVKSVTECQKQPDEQRVVGTMGCLIDFGCTETVLGFFSSAVCSSLARSGGCSGPWDLNFSDLASACVVEVSDDSLCFPLKLMQGKHISRLVLRMHQDWQMMKQASDLDDFSREEVEDLDEFFSLIMNFFPITLRNTMKLVIPSSLGIMNRAKASEALLVMQSIARNLQETNVVQKTPVSILRAFYTVFEKLPQCNRTADELFRVYRGTTGSSGVGKSYAGILKGLFEDRCYVDIDVLSHIAEMEAQIRVFDQRNVISTPFSWEVLNAIFRHDWSRSLKASDLEQGSKAANMISYSNKFFDPRSCGDVMRSHAMLGKESLLLDESGQHFEDADSLRRTLLLVVSRAVARYGFSRKRKTQRLPRRRDILDMKFTVVMWHIFKSQQQYYSFISGLSTEQAERLHKQVLSGEYAVQVAMSTSSTTFSECLKETDACRRPNFEGLNASEATFAARQVLKNMSVLKTEEQRRQDIIRCQEEEAIRRKQEELIEKAAEERRAIKAKLEKVRLEQLEKDESQALVRQRQEVASAIEALKEAQNRCTQHKKQIEEDILNASISLMESRIKLPVKAVEDIPKSSATFELSGEYTDLGADGFSTPPPKSTSGGSLSGWLGDAIRTFRRHLKGHSPEAVYIDLCEDRYGNGSDHSSLALGCRDQSHASTIEGFVRELLEQSPVDPAQKCAVVVRAPTSGSGYFTSNLILGCFASTMVKENELPILCQNNSGDSQNTVEPAEAPAISDGRRVYHRSRRYWDQGQPIELSFKEQFQNYARSRGKRRKRKRVGEAEAQAQGERGMIIPPVQENIYVLQRATRRASRGRKPEDMSGETELRQQLHREFYDADYSRLVVAAERERPFSRESSDLSCSTLKVLFRALGVRRGSNVVILSPGEKNCNSVVATCAALEATALLPLRCSHLEDFHSLHTSVLDAIKTGLRTRAFAPLHALPQRHVTETLDFMMGARRQVIWISEGRDMTSEEEKQFEVSMLDSMEMIVPIHYRASIRLPEWREAPLASINARIRMLSGEEIRAKSFQIFNDNVTVLEKDGGTWLYAKHPFEPDDEIFRFDGLVHVCARARSVVDIIAADAGDPSYTTDHISSSRSPNKCEAPRGFPPNGWKIGVISVEMPVKVYEWSSVENKSSPHMLECGKMYLCGSTSVFNGMHILKGKADLQKVDIKESNQSSPVKVVVDEGHNGVFRVIAREKLYTGDLLWLPQCIDRKAPIASDIEAVVPSSPENKPKRPRQSNAPSKAASSKNRKSRSSGTSQVGNVQCGEAVLGEYISKAVEVVEADGQTTVKRSGRASDLATPRLSQDVTSLRKLSEVTVVESSPPEICSSAQPKTCAALQGHAVSESTGSIGRVTRKPPIRGRRANESEATNVVESVCQSSSDEESDEEFAETSDDETSSKSSSQTDGSSEDSETTD